MIVRRLARTQRRRVEIESLARHPVVDPFTKPHPVIAIFRFGEHDVMFEQRHPIGPAMELLGVGQ